MANKLESKGTYLFKIIESGLGLTKNNFPRAIMRLAAVQKYVEDAPEIAHFQQQQLLADGKPAYIDWTAFGEETVESFVLFKSASEFTKDTALLNYEQLQIATGWDGLDFDALINGSLVDKVILGRVDFESYTNPDTNKTTEGFRVKWIDKADADPNRSLKSVDADQVSKLSAMLKMGLGAAKPKPAAAAAKPAAAVAVATKPVASTAPAVATSISPSSVSSAPTTSKPPKVSKKKVEAPPVPIAMIEETTQDAAWAYVIENKGTATDDAVTNAWIAACEVVGPTKEQTDFTSKDWLNVRNVALSKLVA